MVTISEYISSTFSRFRIPLYNLSRSYFEPGLFHIYIYIYIPGGNRKNVCPFYRENQFTKLFFNNFKNNNMKCSLLQLLHNPISTSD